MTEWLAPDPFDERRRAIVLKTRQAFYNGAVVDAVKRAVLAEEPQLHDYNMNLAEAYAKQAMGLDKALKEKDDVEQGSGSGDGGVPTAA